MNEPLTIPRYVIATNGELQPHPDGEICRWEEMRTAVDLLRQELQRNSDQKFRHLFFPAEAGNG